MKERINKVLSQRGVCSRREADRLIEDGRVLVNGRKAEMGEKIGPEDEIEVDELPIDGPSKRIYILLHKPIGVITTTDHNAPDNVIDFLGLSERVFPVGRLDVESSGLLLLTNDGELAERLMHPKYEHDKEYDIQCVNEVDDAQLERLKLGIRLEDGLTLPAKVKRLTKNRFLIALKQGKNRQIRRMCDTVGLDVMRLRRVGLHTLKLGRLKPGEWRELSKKEVADLKSE